MAVEIKSPEQIEGMRATSRLAASLLEYIEEFVVPGVSTNELNRLCHEYTEKHGAISAPLNYRGFPKSICTSINEVVCHGIPSERVLLDGDIINIDVTTIVDGYHGDTSEMFCVGEVTDEVKKLIRVTHECLWLGILEVAPQKRIGDIGAKIFEHAHKLHKYGVVEAFCGHGIGREFHMAPQVPHVGRKGTGPRMRPGMTFTIEPMINEGTPQCEVLADGWTAITRDNRLSAQAEHTLLVTEDGYEILSARGNMPTPESLGLV